MQEVEVVGEQIWLLEAKALAQNVQDYRLIREVSKKKKSGRKVGGTKKAPTFWKKKKVGIQKKKWAQGGHGENKKQIFKKIARYQIKKANIGVKTPNCKENGR